MIGGVGRPVRRNVLESVWIIQGLVVFFASVTGCKWRSIR